MTPVTEQCPPRRALDSVIAITNVEPGEAHNCQHEEARAGCAVPRRVVRSESNFRGCPRSKPSFARTRYRNRLVGDAEARSAQGIFQRWLHGTPPSGKFAPTAVQYNTRIYFVGFKADRLSYAERGWYNENDELESVLGALESLADNMDSQFCSVSHEPVSKPGLSGDSSICFVWPEISANCEGETAG